MTKYYIGIDTSAYTTSLAALNENKEIIFDMREILEVPLGQRGLRQQEAIFQHINNLPKLFNKLTKEIDINNIVSVSGSNKPRNIDDSYMPVFKVSQGQAFILSKILNVEYNEFSHQEGHIAAGLLGCNVHLEREFLALHISGGTTELIHIKNNYNNHQDYQIEVIGGTKDISAGQLIDRIGVSLGLHFPCGNSLEELSTNGKLIDKRIPISTNKSWINFSGPETFFYKLVDEKYNTEDVSITVLNYVANSLANIISNAINEYQCRNILFIGGVASNTYIRSVITDRLCGSNVKLHFPDKKFCTDNAIGIAYLGNLKKRI